MKRFYIFISLLAVTLTALLGLVKITNAYYIHAGNNVTTSGNQKIYDSVYMAGRTVDINNEVFGDVFCAGQNINVSGTVHGDVICAGQTVNVSGKVDGDVRLAGQNITLGADVTGNATVGGQSFILDSRGSVGGDLTLGSADSTLNGPAGRDIVTGGGTVIINNSVGRDIKAQTEHLKLQSKARVNGNIELISKQDLSKDPSAIVQGKVTHTEPKQEQAKSKHGAVFGFGIVWFIYLFLAMLITALVLTLLFPRFLQATTDKAMPYPWKALLTGFLASILVPILIVLLMASLIGIPLAILAGALWVMALLLSGPSFAYYLGRLILRGKVHPLLIMLVGASILIVLYFVPVLGIISLLAATWIGTGTLILEVFGRTPKPSYTKVPVRSQ